MARECDRDEANGGDPQHKPEAQGAVAREAAALFDSGYNCAESVLLSVHRVCGLASAGVPRVATGFGGGMARRGLVCGALAGSIMALGLACGRDNPDQDRQPCYDAVGRVVDALMERCGSVNCRDISGIAVWDAEGLKHYWASAHETRCKPVVTMCASVTARLIEELRSGGRAR